MGPINKEFLKLSKNILKKHVQVVALTFGVILALGIHEKLTLII